MKEAKKGPEFPLCDYFSMMETKENVNKKEINVKGRQ
jgi:hypothetical protein